MRPPRSPFSGRTVLVTGGAGFIGSNVVERVLAGGGNAVVLDDLSRPGVRNNLHELVSGDTAGRLRVHIDDIRDRAAVRRALAGVDTVFHFAAQVAVTTSVDDPAHDFDVNLGGTFTLLDEVRGLPEPPLLLFTSTNKVYGKMADLTTRRDGDRHVPEDAAIARFGVGEERALSFCSPYGCSKGGADQYVLDFSRTYGIPAVVFRMSCIYGPHQCGNEDQGWVAHFILQALAGKPITIFGDGRQVRDVLFVDDLVAAMERAVASIDQLSGQAFNIGGGPGNTLSLLELLDLLERLGGRAVDVAYEPWRVGDQQWYVSDVRRFAAATGWSPQVPAAEGVERLYRWLAERADAQAATA